ncbi:MAG: DUF692 domain-containing protein [Proteobacteria bacterium]|nr:DUF692 domain-containing protein [Pseudomonadota bacterium]
MIGVGLRAPHFSHVLENKTRIDWFEVHSENFFVPMSLSYLMKVREKYPISLHGIGLSLGSKVDTTHLARLKALQNNVDPFLISEHLSWSKINQTVYPDLFPVPYNKESMQRFCDNIDMVQSFLQRTLLIENPSSYIEYTASDNTEEAFLVTIATKTGCKILLDINNVYVSCANHGWDPEQYIMNIPSDLVGEIHLAGHTINKAGLLIDTHDNAICAQVWQLFNKAVKRFKHCPTLIEWDANIPAFCVLEEEALKMNQYL